VDAQGRITSAVDVPIAAYVPDLQQVTAQGAVSTDTIDVGGLVAAGLIYPNIDGASGDYLTTDGAGALSWITPPATPDLNAVTTAGSSTANTIDIGALVAASLTYPVVDGVAGDYLTTDGSGTLGWVTPPSTPDLQAVTDAGAASTNAIDVAGLTSAGLIYPLVDGASGDYLTTDGAGNLSWLTPTAPTLQTVTTTGNATTNAIDVAGLVAAGLFYPLSDGTVNQVMATDGGGNLGWLSTLKVVPAPTGSGDPGVLGEVAIDTGFFYFFDGTNWLQVPGNIF
jgi:hypothetical protein